MGGRPYRQGWGRPCSRPGLGEASRRKGPCTEGPWLAGRKGKGGRAVRDPWGTGRTLETLKFRRPVSETLSPGRRANLNILIHTLRFPDAQSGGQDRAQDRAQERGETGLATHARRFKSNSFEAFHAP